MPTTQWQQPTAVVGRLLADPHRFGFFQAVRLLERWLRRGHRIDRSEVLARRIAFRNSLSLAFPASEIETLHTEWRDQSDGQEAGQVERVELTPAFFGLLGSGGALPRHYTEQLAEREALRRGPDRAAPRAFYDIFQHRALVLFYEAWRKHRLPLQYEADPRQRFQPLLLALAGLGHAGLHERLRPAEGGVSDSALAYFAATLQRRPVSAVSLQCLLQHYFDVPVRVECFIGRWFRLPEERRSLLGLANMQLGRGLVAGDRVWQRDQRLRLSFGPLGRERFARFLPGGPAAAALKELLTLLTGHSVEYEVRLLLRASEVRGSRLDADAPRLGWDSFLLTRASPDERHDAGYDLLAAA